MNDLRFAFRQLFKEPRFTIVAVLALAIGIGANTAIFSVVNAVLLKPLPFPQPEQLVAWGSINNRPASDTELSSVSYPDFYDFRAENKSFDHLAVYRLENLALVAQGPPESLRAEKVSSDFFDVFGVRPLLGRTFQRDEEKAGGGSRGLAVILSHAFWETHFRGDRSIIGKPVTLDNRPFTVVGVLPADFSFPLDSDPAQVFVTSALDASTLDGTKPQTDQRGNHSLQGIGRLKPGVTAIQADTELRTIAAALARQYPDSNTQFSAGAAPLRENLVGDVARGLYVLFGAVGCVLLIASANVANLLLARATVRRKEIAVRAALGASRGRIVRQLLSESLLLAILGGFCGLVLAVWGTDFLVSLVPKSIPRAQHIGLDGAVLAFTFLASLGTGVLFGLMPAWQSSRLDLRGALNDSARGSSGSHHRLRNALVVSEVALALLLLTGAGLLLQSFAHLSRVNPGVQPERLFTATIVLPDAAYPKPEKIVAFEDQLLTALRALPGVQSASTVFPLPLSGSNMTTSFDLEEHPKPEGKRDASPTRLVGSDYFHAMGVSLVRGRLFDTSDRLDSKPAIIVNERFAQEYFPNENPLGRRLRPGMSLTDADGPMREIVGVVTNVKHQSLRGEFTPEMYIPASQIPIDIFSLVVRANTSRPAALTGSIREVLRQVDPGLPLTRVKMFEDYISDSLARPRFNAFLLSLFAGVALLLTAIGIYGVMAYSVAQRRHEIGIRMALGAQKSDVLRLVVGGGMRLTAFGVVIGVAAAFALTRLLGNLLYGVGAFDGLTFGAVALLLAGIALVACWLPAQRATAVSPLVALRTE
ncbi:MAG TPA: ABC transporter permease [Chthoniobacterales bacterium]|jgi:putative ABC transport system permease protein